MVWLADRRGREFCSYDELWAWSVADLEEFWSAVFDFYGLRAHTPYERVLGSRAMPGAQWFPGCRLNYAEHLVGGEDDRDRIALLAHSQTRPPLELTFAEFGEQVARARAGLRRLGIVPGDRVVAYMPNIPEALVGFLATASLGAIWAPARRSSGLRSVVDRFAALEPTVMLASAVTAIATATSTGARARVDPRRVADARACRLGCIWRGERSRTRSAGTSSGRAGAARVRSGPVRPPAVRAVLVRHDRAAQGDRARPRRPADRAPTKTRASSGI